MISNNHKFRVLCTLLLAGLFFCSDCAMMKRLAEVKRLRRDCWTLWIYDLKSKDGKKKDVRESFINNLSIMTVNVIPSACRPNDDVKLKVCRTKILLKTETFTQNFAKCRKNTFNLKLKL